MDYFREMLNMGGNIMDTVNDAINRNDYEGLAKNITEQMAQFTRMTASDVRGRTRPWVVVNGKKTGGFWPQDIDLGTRPSSNYEQQKTAYQGAGYNQNASSAAGQFTGNETGAGYNAGQAYDERRQQRNASWNYSAQNTGNAAGSNSRAITPFNQYRPKTANSILMQVLGVCGLFISIPTAIGFIGTAAAFGTLNSAIGAAIMGACAGASWYATSKGGRQRRLIGTFDKYSNIIGSSEYSTIEHLARSASEPEDLVSKNLDKMIAAGMLPQAKFDTNKTTLMLTKNAYEQYLLAEDARKDREQQEAELDAQVGSSEARKVIEEGEAFVVKIRQANDSIPGKEMSDKLDQMERIVSKIFAQVRKEPSSAEDLRKFMNYYLPTTEKLLNAYIDLDKQPEVGENITNTKREIEGTMDTINNAFENLLDSLFQDVAWDITSDISVMKTMMEQDGLTSQDSPIPDIAPAVDFTTKEDK